MMRVIAGSSLGTSCMPQHPAQPQVLPISHLCSHFELPVAISGSITSLQLQRKDCDEFLHKAHGAQDPPENGIGPQALEG